MHDIVDMARIGNIYVNRNQIGAVVGVQPFGGEGLSGTGPKAGGPHYLAALQKTIRLDGSGFIPVTDDNSENLTTSLKAAAKSFAGWMPAQNKTTTFEQAAANAQDDIRAILKEAVNIRRTHFEDIVELPGPTGESNTLKFKGRGVLLALGGGDDQANLRQLSLGLASGNAIICDHAFAKPLQEALGTSEFTDNAQEIVQEIDLTKGVAQSILHDDHLSGVIFDGSKSGRDALTSVLAARKGAIIPVLSSHDQPNRYAVERTLTINTTAAGGDVRLLSLSH